MIDPSLHLVLAAALAVLLLDAGWHKLRDATRFEAQLAAYRLLPAAAVPPAAAALPWLELGLAVALLMPAARPYAGAGVAALLSVYALAMAINLARGRRDIDCGCGDRPQPLSGWLLLRNGVLALAALALLEPASARPLGWLDLLLGVPALLVLIGCYMTVEQLFDNAALGRPRRNSGD